MTTPMDAYSGDGRARRTQPEIKQLIESRLAATLVLGLGEMGDTGDARCAGDRISGYAERHTYGEWLLPLSAKRGMRWQTQAVPESTRGKVAFYLSLAFGNGSPLPQPSGQFDVFVNDRLAVSCRVVNHSQIWRGEECVLAFAANRLESAAPFGSLTLSSIIRDEAFATFGPALLVVPSDWVSPGAPTELRVEARCPVESTRWLQLDQIPGMLNQTNIYQVLALLDRRPRIGNWDVCFGDIHTHSGQVLEENEGKGCGLGSRRENYEYALGPGGLDFYALTDHEWQVDPAKVAEYLALALEYEQPGRFACLPAFEFTSLVYGHRNVYFRGPGGTVVNANRTGGRPILQPADSTTPEELWAALQATGVPFMTVPHHPSSTSHPCNLGIFNEAFDRLIEVYSVWGSSEYYGDFPRGVSDRYRTLDVREAIQRGHRVGLIASADGHDGHPGNAQGPIVKHHHQFHFCGSGRAAVLTNELTRESVFDALHARRCYATTGTPIVLDARVNGHVMGSHLPSLPPGERPRVAMHCLGTNGIDHVRVVRDGQIVHTAPGHGQFEMNLEWEDRLVTTDSPHSYYVRVVQIDRESAWSSPVWIG
ncbi:MAG: DUF3604 domain-containing protein [Victivallales bacterium]|nr:DUF3604 domain-containing protein [Victivallales bacterium]